MLRVGVGRWLPFSERVLGKWVKCVKTGEDY